MKNRLLSFFIVFSFFVSHVSVIKPESTWQKVKGFASRNKGKIIALGLAAVATGLGIGVAAYVKEKADTAIEKAGIRKDGPYYAGALLFLTTVGNIPQEQAIKFILMYFDEGELLQLWNNNIIKALAYYWDMTPAVLYGKLGLKLSVQQVKEIASEVTEAIHDGFNTLRGRLGFGPKAKPAR